MKAWGVSFTPNMQTAVEEGRKTMTRRVVHQQPDKVRGDELCWGEQTRTVAAQCPYTGPELRERAADQPGWAGGLSHRRRPPAAGGSTGGVALAERYAACALYAEVATRTQLVEAQASIKQLGEISEADAWAEGMQPGRNSITRHEHEDRDLYRALWEAIHRPGSWCRRCGLSPDTFRGKLTNLIRNQPFYVPEWARCTVLHRSTPYC